MSREKVLAIFREVETAKEVKLNNFREHRRQIICDEEHCPGVVSQFSQTKWKRIRKTGLFESNC